MACRDFSIESIAYFDHTEDFNLRICFGFFVKRDIKSFSEIFKTVVWFSFLFWNMDFAREHVL